MNFASNEGVGLAKLVTTFTVAHDDVAATDVRQHHRANLAGKGPLLFRVKVLPPERDRRAADDFSDARQIWERRTNRDADAGLCADTTDHRFGQLLRSGGSREHLPVARDE